MTERFVPATSLPADLFVEGYARWCDPLYAYVSRSVAGRQVRERIVRQVLTENLDLLVGRREEALEVGRLTATADRLIADAIEEADVFLERRREARAARQLQFPYMTRASASGEIE